MFIYFENLFKEWCAESDDKLSVAWGKTKEEAIENLNKEFNYA